MNTFPKNRFTAAFNNRFKGGFNSDRPLLISEFKGVFDQLAVDLVSGEAIPLTYAEAQALVAANELIPGLHYNLTDKADGGIQLLAITPNKFSLEGQGIFLNPDFQDTVLGSNNFTFVGVWHSGLAGLVSDESVTVWNGIQYKNLTGVVGTDPDGDAVNWEIIDKTINPELYAKEVDFIIYDFNNDVIIWEVDRRNNRWNPSYVTSFQKGNDLVKGNYIEVESNVDIINQRGTIINNIITGTNNGYLEATSDFTGSFNHNKVFDTNISITDLAAITACRFEIHKSITFGTGDSYNEKTVTDAFSNFEKELDMTDGEDYASGPETLTIPVEYNYVGRFTLLNNSGQTISKIVNLSDLFVTTFRVGTGENQSFNHTAVGSVTDYDLVADAVGSNIINGSRQDFIQYEKITIGAAPIGGRINGRIAAS